MRRCRVKPRKRIWGVALASALALAAVLAVPEGAWSVARAGDPPQAPATPNAVARRWFEDAKFGLFVHWGVYSLLGKGEWVMNNDKLPVSEYRKLPPRFNPVKFDAEEWVGSPRPPE